MLPSIVMVSLSVMLMYANAADLIYYHCAIFIGIGRVCGYPARAYHSMCTVQPPRGCLCSDGTELCQPCIEYWPEARTTVQHC